MSESNGTGGTAYDSLAHLRTELVQALRPYEALVRFELRSARPGERYWDQITQPGDYRQAYQCRHAMRRAVQWTLSNGVKRVCLQCVACGDKHTTGVRKANYSDDLPQLDERLIDEGRDAFMEFSHQLWEISRSLGEEWEQNQKAAMNADWWEKYNAYLKTPAWKDKRKRVLERDAYACQACLRREATHVHHLTYDRVFREPLFDLIAVCEPCHVELHPHMEAAHE